MTDHELSQSESFILNSKEEVIQKTIKGTDSYYYFKYIQLLGSQELNLTDDQKEELAIYANFNSTRAQDIKLRHLFKQYDSLLGTDQEEQRLKVLQQINEQLLGIHFYHSQPQNVQAGNILVGQQAEVVSVLDNSTIDVNKILEKAYTDHQTFYQLQQPLLSQVDISRLYSAPQEVQNHFVQAIGPTISTFKGVPEFLTNFYNTMKQKNKHFEFQKYTFCQINLAQLEDLSSRIPSLRTNSNFVEELFLKKFNKSKIEQEPSSPEQIELTKKRLMEIYEWALTLPPVFESLSDQYLYELLQLGIDINEYDFDLFHKYLSNPKQNYANANEQQRQKFQQKNKHYQSQWHTYHGLNTGRWLDDNSLVSRYLEKYFQTNDEATVFEAYLDKKYLAKLLTQSRLYQGKDVQAITDIFNGQQLKQMNDEKLISLCSFNKKSFAHGEPVKLFVELKNIPNLTIKVFEVCTENYLLKNNKAVDNSINLDGLIAQQEQVFKNSEAPIVKTLKEFTFEKIAAKERGIFIVEFIGNGVTSRAIIKKGRLVLQEKLTVAGHVFQILDENLNIASGDKTGVWINKKLYKVNKNKEVIVPYVASQQEHSVVIVHEDFADLGKVTLLEENYNFTCAFIYSTESMLMSSKAKILIQPKLYINQVPASFQLVSEPQVVITTTNEHDIPSTMVFDKLKFDRNEELEIEFPIAAKLKLINIDVNAKVDKLHSTQDQVQETLQSNKQDITASHQIIFDNYQGKRIFCSQFLRYTQENGYELYLLGKNGEPKAGIDVDLRFNLLHYSSPISQTLTTNEEGTIKLGQLQGVVTLFSSVYPKVDISAEGGQWSLINSFRVNYPTSITLVQGDDLTLPYLGKTLNQNEITFISLVKDEQKGILSVLADERSKLILENGVLKISNLEVGNYVLTTHSPHKIVEIRVLQGKYWKNTQLLVWKDTLADLKQEPNQLVLIGTSVSQNENDSTSVQATYSSSNPKQTRVHAIALQFLPTGQTDDIARRIQEQIINQQPTQTNVSKPVNKFYSNKRLSDEQKYVLDRKNQERYVGNTLEKPQILLKRQYIRDTDLTQEELNQEGDFENQPASDRDDSSEGRFENAYEEKKKNKPAAKRNRKMLAKSSKSDRNGYGGQQPQSYVEGGYGQYQGDYIQPDQGNKVNSFLNFLKNPSFVIGNINLNDQGKATFTFPSGLYSTVILVATNNSDVILEILPLPKTIIQTRDLSQKSAMKQDKFYSIFRNQSVLEQDNLIQFNDLTSTELQIVDSVSKLFTLLKELRKCHGSDSEQSNGFDFWEFLQRWDRLDFDEKHKLFDKYQCDELNLFIFFKDRAYFETYVRQYIANKLEQSFIDNFLLEKRSRLLVHSEPQNLENLNALEQVLLVIYFAEISLDEGDRQIAKEIVNYLDTRNKIAPVDQRNYKRLFDTVLEAKTSEGHATTQQDLLDINMGFAGFAAPTQAFSNIMHMNLAPQMFIQQQNPFHMNQNIQQEFDMAPCSSTFAFGIQQQKRDCSKEEMEYEECDENQCDFPEDPYVQARKQFQQDFKNQERTKEYAERHYYSSKVNDQNQHLVTLNGFWVDLAKHSLDHGIFKKPFLSSKFIFCNQNHTQMISVLALQHLPFATPNHKYTPFEGKGVQIRSASTSLIFTKEIKEGQADLKVDILVAQRFFDPKDRYVFSDEDPTVKVEKDISEYIVNKVYGCQVIVTNCTVTKYDFQVLVEVPSGSIPVETVDYTKNHNITLDPYTTKTIEFFFYFPTPGHFNVYPANVARFGNVVAVAKTQQFLVNKGITKTNLETMDEILSKGSKEDILNFISIKNIMNPNIFRFSDIYYLLKDKDFYIKVLAILRSRKIFDYTTWSFSIKHGDHQSLREFFQSQQVTASLTQFKYLKCSLFEQSGVRYVEYYPLVSQRVHQLSQDRNNILNIQFKEQYSSFIEYLVQKGEQDLSDKLVFIYYLLLQERINEAIQVYKSIKVEWLPQSGEAKLQYDYFTAYLDFYIGYPNFIQARQVCEKYLDCPAIHWRNLFFEIVNQLTEYDGEEIDENLKQKVQSEQTKKKNEQGADKEQVLSLQLESYNLVVTHQNLQEATIQLYKIDLEVLFSRNPFISQGSEDFAYVQPNHVFTVALQNDAINPSSTKTVVEIPEAFRKHNVFIQINAGEKRVQTTYFSTSLQVQVLENYGQVKVQDENGKFLSKIYIKTFAKQKDGKVIFYKDGYTDLRGRLDYATLNPESLRNVDKFAVFVMSDDRGSLIKEVKAPSQVGHYEQEVKLISKAWGAKKEQTRIQQVQTYEMNSRKYK